MDKEGWMILRVPHFTWIKWTGARAMVLIAALAKAYNMKQPLFLSVSWN
jgi:hypothetical protein